MFYAAFIVFSKHFATHSDLSFIASVTLPRILLLHDVVISDRIFVALFQVSIEPLNIYLGFQDSKAKAS